MNIFLPQKYLENSGIKEMFEKFQSKAFEAKGVSINEKDDAGFYKFVFSDINKIKCPFSIWLERSGQHFFLNIGDEGKEVAIFHYSSANDKSEIQAANDFLNFFLEEKVLEKSIYCSGRLKRITYKILSKEYFPSYSYLNESYFFCFKKNILTKTYEPWLDELG